MDIHEPVFRSAVESFELEKSELGRFIEEAGKELEAIGDFWGGTKEGVAFYKGEGGGSGYEAVTGQVMEGMDVLLYAHEEIARRLRFMKDNVSVTDWVLVSVMLSKLPPPDPDRPIWGAD
ncbi:hypothetical protein [Nonomuraea sp. NPDC049400]|uniref:hypothetical protein n=1 Tax=Nonomuraea sp. NPDC049400 TaxID=3364352 RepID=UPI003798D4B8